MRQGLTAVPMTGSADDKRDFFVSFNEADRAWAEWIAWALEHAGYSVWYQHWDFKGDFVLDMDEAHDRSHRTVGILSPDALKSENVRAEWNARRTEDPTNRHDRLVLIRVSECEPPGLLKPFVWLDVIGCNEADAKERVLGRIRGLRRKPDEPPLFPDATGRKAVPDEETDAMRQLHKKAFETLLSEERLKRLSRIEATLEQYPDNPAPIWLGEMEGRMEAQDWNMQRMSANLTVEQIAIMCEEMQIVDLFEKTLREAETAAQGIGCNDCLVGGFRNLEDQREWIAERERAKALRTLVKELRNRLHSGKGSFSLWSYDEEQHEARRKRQNG